MAKLTDIDDFCLEKILTNLNLVDLLNVANTSRELRSAAESVYQRNGNVNLDIFSYLNTLESPENEKVPSQMCTFKTILQFLRCFGHLQTKLEVQYTNICDSKCDLISRYIYQFCSKSLVGIKFYDIKESDFDGINRPFLNVEDVEFTDCCIGKELSQFHRWFPKMRRLTLFCSELAEPINIVTHFPNLKDLSLSGYLEANYVTVVAATLRLNPQLKTLKLGPFFKDAQFLEYIGRFLENLESINISWDLDSVYNLSNTEINFKNIKEFKLHLYGEVTLPEFPFLFERLERFTLETDCHLNDNLIDFIAKHPTITRLSLIGLGDQQDVLLISNDIKTQIAKTLPWLEKMYLINYNMSVDDVDQFLKEFKSLKTFLFTLDDGTKPNRNNLNWFMGNEWKTSPIGYRRYTNVWGTTCMFVREHL